MNFIAFDLETTGTLPGVDKIVEIGAIRYRDGQVDGVFSTLVDPLQSIPAGASAVNGITDDMVMGKPKIEELLEPLSDFCSDSILVAHNAVFDFGFLLSAYTRHEIRTPRGLILDTYPMAKKIYPGLANYRLGTLVQHLNIDAAGFHRAEADASYCGQVLQKMLDKISTGGVTPPVQNLVALTGKPEMRFPVIEPQPKQLNLLDLL